MKPKTRPATVAAILLTVLYALAAASSLWLADRVGEIFPDRPDGATAIRTLAAAATLLALLWTWAALACRRRHASPIILVAIGITTADVLWGVLNEMRGPSGPDVIELVKSLVRGVLVAVVFAWRPRAAGTAMVPSQPAPPAGTMSGHVEA